MCPDHWEEQPPLKAMSLSDVTNALGSGWSAGTLAEGQEQGCWCWACKKEAKMRSGKLSGVKGGGNNWKLYIHRTNEDHRAGCRKADVTPVKGGVSVRGCLPVRWFAVGSGQCPEQGSWMSLVRAAVGERFFTGQSIGLDEWSSPFWSSGFPRLAFHRGKIQKTVLVLFYLGINCRIILNHLPVFGQTNSRWEHPWDTAQMYNNKSMIC